MSSLPPLDYYYSSANQDAEDKSRETTFENIPTLGGKLAVGVANVQRIVSSLINDEEERQETIEVLRNVRQNLKPEFVKLWANQIPAAVVDLATADLSGFGYNEKQQAIRNKADKFLKEKYKEIDTINKYLIKDTGEGIVKGIKQGDASDLIGGLVNANVQMVQTVVPAMMTYGASLPFQIVGPMYTDYNTIKAENLYGKDDPEAINKLIDAGETEIATPFALGLLATGFEYLGFKGVTKYMLGNQAASKMASNLFFTSNREGITELLQNGVEGISEAKAQGKSNEDAMQEFFKGIFSEEGLESYLNGFVGSAGIGTAGRAVNRALRSDKASVKEINEQISNLAELNLAKNSTRDQEVREALEQEIETKEQELKNYIKEKRKVSNVLNEDQKVNLINLITQKDNIRSKAESLKNKLDNNQITSKDFGYAMRSLNNQNKKIIEQIELINETAKQQSLTTSLEKTKEEAAKLGYKQKELSKEEFTKLFPNEAEADGTINPETGEIIINVDVAREQGAIGVGSHELLHAIIGNSYDKLKTEQKTKLNKDFLNILGSKDKQTILNRLSSAYNITGDKVFTTEELFTAFSDAIVDGEIKYDESIFSKAKNVIQELLNKVFGYQKEFENARQTFNFLKDYSKNIKKNKLTKRAAEFAKQDPGVQGRKMSRSSLVEDINKLQQGATTKAEFQKPGVFNEVFKAIQPGGAINNYIRSLGMSTEKTEETIDSVTDRLINFDPAAKRKDGSTIGPKGLGEFIMANVGFGKLDAAKALAKKGEKKKRETTIDKAKDVTDTTTPTPQETEVKDVKLRKLKEFNIELDDGLANSLTIVEVNNILDKLNENKISFEQAQKQINTIALKDIRAALSEIIPKISKGKPTPEYEAFIRREYDEIVQSLGIKTIRTAYRPWFKKKKVGRKDYKNIDPETGKVSNYRKDVFENTTNKREYIKWFLEAKPGSLLERRTALIRRIAKRKASLAVDNYIEQNSNNIEAIVKVKMKKLSESSENAANEQTSFDSVKFSMTNKSNYDRINRKMEKDGQYKAPDGSIMTFYKKADGTWNKGFVFEQATNETMQGIVKRIKGYYVDSVVSTEKGGYADLVIVFPDGQAENHEIKQSPKARQGSVKFTKINLETEEYILANPAHKNIPGLDKIVKESIKVAKQKIKQINQYSKEYNEKYGYKKGDPEFADQVTGNERFFIPAEVDDRMSGVLIDPNTGKKGLGKTLVKKIIPGRDVIANGYENKKVIVNNTKLDAPVRSITYGGVGSYRLSEKSKFTGLPLLDVDVEVRASLRNSKSIDNYRGGKVKFRDKFIGIEFYISGKIKNEPNSGILTEESFMQATGAPAFSKTVSKAKIIDKAVNEGRTIKFSKTSKGITILDFDDTLATTKSLVKYTTLSGETGTLNAEQYAKTYEDLLDKGYTFDFSDFNKVVKGKLAPLFNKALKLQNKFGPENMFVLTARPPKAAVAIFDFLKANGLNIPLKNITGLGNSTSEAKALWVADKVGEGYNDFYFADDALQNVQAVDNILEQFDVKRKVQQARVKFSKSMDKDFNDIIQDVKGINSNKRYAQAKARKRGEGKGKFRFFIPPSHEDLVGLLYNFIGKGEAGNRHREFFERTIVKPLNRAYNELNIAKQSIANDYRALIKAFPDVRKKLTKKTPDGDYYYSDAVRVYLWNKSGFDVPGMSKADVQELVDLITSDGELQAFADNIGLISKQEQGYVEPGEHWDTGDIRTDLADATGRVGRKKFFTEFIENADIIFSKENLNKIEAAYGLSFREALEDVLHRTKTGTNRTVGQNKIVNRFLDYLNGSIGATMFFNARSAVLQTISTVNFINFGDNNIFAAARAFANQKQFWSDFSMLFNSDMLKQRRAGVAFDVNANEIANAVSKSKEPVRAAIRYLLQIGFLPTQLADSFAISLGGATMYRNRVKTYLKQNMSQKEAETKAFNDFQEISESTQQSARPDKISQQQASPLGRMILAFQNTPSQYVRLMKKAGLDLINRRKTPPYGTQVQSDMSNISKIIYYGAVQNIIFYGLQSAMFAMMFDDEERDEDFFEKKRDRVLNGSLDTILRGMGVGGAVISTIKNTAIKYAENQKKDWGKEDNVVMMEMLQLSPPIGIKARKLSSAQKTMDFNKKVIEEMDTFDIDNPVYSAVSNLIEATTNVPLARLHRKTMNLREAANAENEWWQRLAMALGWSRWDVGVENKEVEAIKEQIKSRNKKKNKGFQGFGSKKNTRAL